MTKDLLGAAALIVLLVITLAQHRALERLKDQVAADQQQQAINSHALDQCRDVVEREAL